MKYFILALTISVLFISCGVSAEPAAEPSNQYRTPHCSPIVRNLPIYQMTAYAKAGRSELVSTVVLVGPNTWATSSHGIRNGEVKKITISLPTGEIEAKVTWFDKDLDIAVLHGNSYDIRPIDSMSFGIGEFEQVWNIGYPGMSDGLIMSFTGFKVRYNEQGLMVTTALGLNGMSGGATVRCVDDHLELVGIITAKVNHRIQKKIWTDKHGILHQKETLVNKGITIISPMKFQK